MASFRTSNVSDWAARESEGYFRRRTSGFNNPPGSRGSGRFDDIASPPPPLPSAQETGMCLPRNGIDANNKLKNKRLWSAFRNAYIWHLILLVALFSVITREIKGFDTSQMGYIGRVFNHASAAVICVPGLLFLFTLYLTLTMFAILITNPNKHGENIQDQITRCTSIRFLFKPVLLVIFINVEYYYIMELFDPNHLYLLRTKTSLFGCDYKPGDCFFMEDRLIIQLATSTAAMDFFMTSYLNGLFELSFSSVPVKRHLGSLFDINEVGKSLVRSATLSICTLILCLFLGPSFYCTILYPTGVEIWEDRFVERFLLMIKLPFLLRLFVYTAVTRTILPLLLKLVNYHLTQPVHFHIEQSPSHEHCMLMSEAMTSNVNFLRYLAFYEYNCKAENGNPDVATIFKITHPGNHPLNWRSLYAASVGVITEMNNGIVNFLRSATMPPNFFQSGLGPYILDQLRDRDAAVQRNGAALAAAEIPRMGNMRDLTASNGQEFPNQLPSITEAIRRHLDLLWIDTRAAVAALFSINTLNTTLFYGRLTEKLQENQIANLLSDHIISYWAIMGTNKLMCLSINADSRGVVNQDIMPFYVKVLETYDVLTALEIYLVKSGIEDHPACEKEIYDKDREVVSKMINACVFALSKLHSTFFSCYAILGMDAEIVQRVMEIISS